MGCSGVPHGVWMAFLTMGSWGRPFSDHPPHPCVPESPDVLPGPPSPRGSQGASRGKGETGLAQSPGHFGDGGGWCIFVGSARESARPGEGEHSTPLDPRFYITPPLPPRCTRYARTPRPRPARPAITAPGSQFWGPPRLPEDSRRLIREVGWPGQVGFGRDLG